jgi:hypothetical protein
MSSWYKIKQNMKQLCGVFMYKIKHMIEPVLPLPSLIGLEIYKLNN